MFGMETASAPTSAPLLDLASGGISLLPTLAIQPPFSKAVLPCYCFAPVLAISYTAAENQLPRPPLAELNMLVL